MIILFILDKEAQQIKENKKIRTAEIKEDLQRIKTLINRTMKKLKKAQFIELGVKKPYNKYNLKFSHHQRIIKNYRKYKNFAIKHTPIYLFELEINQITFDLIKRYETKNYKNIRKEAKVLSQIWKEYKKKCSKIKLSTDKDLRKDINTLGRILINDVDERYCYCC